MQVWFGKARVVSIAEGVFVVRHEKSFSNKLAVCGECFQLSVMNANQNCVN